jgi:uncharacterized protein YgfB (UPF0149 family)
MLNDPTTPEFPAFDAVETALRHAQAPTDAAEAHGSLCGLFCGLGARALPAWLADTLSDAQATEAVQGQTRTLLTALAASTSAALEAAEMGFQPLLPGDGEPLADRVDGLAQWCQGFNHGLFVAGRIGDADAELNSGNTAEIVRDFSEMAQVAVGDEESDAEGEAAFVELVEFVRVSVQLVYEELAAVRQRVVSAGRH